MDLEFSGEVFFWRGPAPWFFVAVPEEESRQLEASSSMVSYGWGVIPVTARIGHTEWKTSLFPKDGLYLVPVKVDVRKKEKVEEGNVIRVRLTVGG